MAGISSTARQVCTVLGIAAGTLLVAPVAHSDGVFFECPSGRDGVVAGTPTSCAFADNVRVAWRSQPGNPVVAYSPVTGQYYSMFCGGDTGITFTDGHSADAVICMGGNNAEVVVW